MKHSALWVLFATVCLTLACGSLYAQSCADLVDTGNVQCCGTYEQPTSTCFGVGCSVCSQGYGNCCGQPYGEANVCLEGWCQEFCKGHSCGEIRKRASLIQLNKIQLGNTEFDSIVMIPSCAGGLIAIAMDSPPMDIAAAADSRNRHAATPVPIVEPLNNKKGH